MIINEGLDWKIETFRTPGFINKTDNMGRVYVDLPLNQARQLKQSLEASRSKVEGLEDWERELRSMLNGMTFPDQIVSHVKALLKAERERLLGEIEEVNKQIPHCANCRGRKAINKKIAEIRGE